MKFFQGCNKFSPRVWTHNNNRLKCYYIITDVLILEKFRLPRELTSLLPSVDTYLLSTQSTWYVDYRSVN